MAPTKQQSLDSEFQRQLFDRMKEIKEGMDESLKLGRANGAAISNLRIELGVDGAHGRLPQLEAQCARLDRRQEDDNKEISRRITELNDCLDELKREAHEAHGRSQLWGMVRGIVGGSAGAALIGYLAKLMGFIH